MADPVLAASAVTRLHVVLVWTPATLSDIRDTEDSVERLTEEDLVRLLETSPTVSAYAVYRDGILLGTTASLTHEDTNVVRGATYTYTVAGWDSGTSTVITGLSNEVVVTIPAQLVFPPVAFAALGDAKPRVYEPKENLTVRGQE